MATWRVGISGWTYAGWRGTFYPRDVPASKWLAYASRRVNAIEVNGTFYSQQPASAFREWRRETPDEFVLALKAPRYITHMLRLTNARSALANFFAEGVLALGPKLGPLLWQLPERVHFDEARLATFLEGLPRSTAEAGELARHHDERLRTRAVLRAESDAPLRHALEVRSATFDVPECLALLRRHGVALVVADSAGRWPYLEEVTAGFVYVRLHGMGELYAGGYDEAAIESWAGKVKGWLARGLDVYVFFDNDAKVKAPFDAMRLAGRL